MAMLRGAILMLAARAAAASNCDYVSDSVTYVDVDNITAEGPVFIGKDPLPENAQGVFWFVNDGGDALVSFGAPPDGDDTGECSNGKLVQKSGSNSASCTSVSTVRPGGWTFQAMATPLFPFGGKFPSIPDTLYQDCGMRWDFCFDSSSTPTTFDASAVATRGLPCINFMALATTTGEYKGSKLGGHYWRVTTKALGIIPMPSWAPGDFDMIQVMDGQGNKVQPAWDSFAQANKQIVYYNAAAPVSQSNQESLVV